MDKWEVIMPCYIINEELLKLTEVAIESLGICKRIIIDNGSPIGGGYLRSKADVYIRNYENLGYAKAVNQGLVLAHLGSYIAIANNDIRVSPNWQEVAKQTFASEKNIYSCHFRMIHYNEPMQYGDRTWYQGKERWCTSSFFVLNKDQPLFLYEERFRYYEDWAYWLKVRREGLKTAYTEKACYQHKDSSTRNIMPKLNEEEAKDKELFKEMYGDYPEALFEKDFPGQLAQDWRSGFSL